MVKKLSLSGITIGLGLNSVDYYEKTKFGATYETHISNAEIKQQGEKIANQVLARLRKKSRSQERANHDCTIQASSN